jgi:hypothetical protein
MRARPEAPEAHMTASNIVQSFWIGPRLSSLHVLGIRSFLAHGHEYHLYTFDEIENVPEGVRVLDASRLFSRENVFTYQEGFGKGSYSAFSNEFRYRLLYEHGGWWVDTDVVCLKPFDFDADFVFACERTPEQTLTTASCVIKSPARSAYLAYCLEVCAAADKAALRWGEIGPRLMHAAVTRFDLARYRVAPEVFNPVDYFSCAEIVAPDFDMSRLAGSSAVHLWHQKWKSHYLNQDYEGDPGSLYGELRRRYLPASGKSPLAELREHARFQQACIAELKNERDETQWALAAAERELHELRGEVEGLRSRLASSQQDLAEAQRELREAQRELREAQHEARALRQSLSWTITAPLRAVYDALKGRAPDRK